MWYYNGIGITVVDFDDADNEQIIAELQPLQAKTIYQVFGSTKGKVTLKALVVGSGDVSALKALLDDGNAYPLSGLENNIQIPIGNFYPKKIDSKRLSSYKQTFRTDKAETDQVFDVTITLLEE